MSVILPRDLEADWLDPDISREHAISLLEPYPAELMRYGGVAACELGGERRARVAGGVGTPHPK